jgi:23S rRNA pseudouridine2605 synthase
MAAGQSSSDHSDNDRVAKVLARAGVASRREVERLIEAGRVAINGATLTTPGVKVEPGDIVTVDGEVVGGPEPVRLFRYHKPAGLVTTHSDPKGRPTVFQHLPEGLPRVISIGRLDLATEGLLLLTNDGGLSRALELPSTGWIRRYRARAFGYATQERLDKLKDGVTVDGVRYGPIDAHLDKATGDRDGARNVWITLTLAEGKNREVRVVLESIGLKVNRLLRLSYGPFSLGDLGAGQVEEVGPRVIRELLEGVVPPEAMPKGNTVQYRVPTGPGRRKPSGEAGGTPHDPEAAPARRHLRPGQESGEIKGERQAKKPGWAKAKPKLNPHARSGGAKKRPEARVAEPKKKTWHDGPKTARVDAPRGHGPRPERGDTPRGGKPSGGGGGKSFAKPAGAPGPRPFAKPGGRPAGSRPTGPKGKR